MDNRKSKQPHARDGERWIIDPRDVHRYERRADERRRKGLTGKPLRFGLAALAAVVVFVGYWNFDTLREMRIGFSLPTGSFGRDAADDSGASRDNAESAPVAVEAPAVVGADEPLVRDEDPALQPEEDAASAAVEPLPESAPAPPLAGTEPPPALAGTEAPPPLAGTEARPPTPAPEPPAPVEPETFHFGLDVNTASEADAAALVLVLRNGGTRGVSSLTWWTTNGTATGGVDYADLGRVELQFPAGAQNRAIRIPIVGDRVAEGPENFYVHLQVPATGGAAAETLRAEVIINDDD